MILKFTFEYQSTSLVLENILLRELKSTPLTGKLEKYGDFVSLYVKGGEEELQDFADNLSLNMPYSLFLKDTKVEAVDIMPEEDYILPNYPKRELPFCPKCEKKAFEDYDPFVKCVACGYSFKSSTLKYKNFAKIITKDNERIFKNFAKVLKNGAVAKIKTFNGYKSISLMNQKNFEKIKGDFDLLCVDLGSVGKICSIGKSEILALGSFEKPILELFVNHNFLNIFPFIKNLSKVRVRLSNDLMLDIICKEVGALGSYYIILSDCDEQKQYDIEIDFDSKIFKNKSLEAIVLDDGQSVITKGDLGLVPKVNDGFKDISLKAFSNNFVAINDNAKIITYKRGKELPPKLDTFTLGEGDLSYEAAHGAFYAVLSEHSLLDKTIAGVYFSKINNDRIMINSPKFGLVDYIIFDFNFPKTLSKLLKIMKNENETSSRLVENFITKFPDFYKDELKFSKMGNIYKLWGVIAIMLGMQNDGDVKKGAIKLIKYAASFKGKKGPRIDYKLKKDKNKPKLDNLKAIKTAMSFKLAGIDFPTLSFGVMESFAEFASNILDDISRDYEMDGVCFNGSLFESANLINKFYTITKKNYKVYLHKEFTLDDMNLCYGIINAACKK